MSERADRAMLLEGLAAQLYMQSGGFWWHIVRESVRQEWRAKAEAEVASGRIAQFSPVAQ